VRVPSRPPLLDTWILAENHVPNIAERVRVGIASRVVTLSGRVSSSVARMRIRSASSIGAIALAVWSVVATVTGLALVAVTPAEGIPSGFRLENIATYLTMPASLATVGTIIALRRPSNLIGWSLTLAGALAALQYLTGGYAVRASFAPTPLPGGDLAAWIFNWSGSVVGVALFTLLSTFPDETLPPRAARVGLALGVLAGLLATALLAFSPGRLRNFPGVENPFPLLGSADVPLSFVTAIIAVPALALAGRRLWRRGRASAGAERQQFKWFIGGVLVLVVLSGASVAFADRALSNVAISAGVAAPPIAIGVAILRYRLYDIDLLIKRTVVYGATSAMIAATFFVGIVALQGALRPGSELAIAASTLVSFALFQPVRRRVQDAVDRRYDRSRYDAARTLDDFADRLRDEVDLDTLRNDLLGAVRETMSPSYASLWLRARGR
jgi:hypothetical protein